jgi:hypothetical protein
MNLNRKFVVITEYQELSDLALSMATDECSEVHREVAFPKVAQLPHNKN